MDTPLRVDHLALPITDPEESLRFYTDVLDLELVGVDSGDDWEGKPWLMMTFALSDDRQLVLCAVRGAKPASEPSLPKDVRHFGFACESKQALSDWKQRLQRHEVPFREEDHGSQRSLYFEDPNGIVLEITTPRTAAARTPVVDPFALVRAWSAGSS
jgi:catechol 2,3-dioxygenase-like lactoylglutathione lyase family enzyme